MADTVQISRLSSTLDECLSKIERLGVSLKDLKSNEAVLAEFESALDDIQKKKDALLGSSAADSVKQQVGDLMGKLQDAMGSGANLSSLFGSINRIRDLTRSGGESLPSFSPSARARYQDVSDSYAAAGFGRGGAPQSGLVRNVRSVVTDVPSGTSASYGGMNAFMSTRALAMGDALSGYSVTKSSRSLSQQLADETQSDAMDDSVATIQRTSDEILDALQRPREAKGSVKVKTTVKREVQKRDGGFSWGGLLKTVGTVGLIGGALFGALGSETVSRWLVDMTDPKKREAWINKQKEWFEKKWNEFKPVWETTQKIASQVWDVVSKLGTYLGGVSVGSLETVGASTYEGMSTSLSAGQMAYVESVRDAELAKPAIEVAGVSGGLSARAKEIIPKVLETAGLAYGGKKLSISFLRNLYRGATHLRLMGQAAASLGGAVTSFVGPVAVGALLLSVGKAIKDEAEREVLNSLSAQAAMEEGLPFFYAYVKGAGNNIEPVPFFRLSDGDGGMYGASLSNEGQLGLIMKDIGATKHLVNLYNERAVLETAQTTIAGRVEAAKAALTVARVGRKGSSEEQKRFDELSSLHANVKNVLDSGSAEDVTSMLSKLKEMELLPEARSYNYQVVPFDARGDLFTLTPGVADFYGVPTLKLIQDFGVGSDYVDTDAVVREGKWRPTRSRFLNPLFTRFGGDTRLAIAAVMDAAWLGDDSPNFVGELYTSNLLKHPRVPYRTGGESVYQRPYLAYGIFNDSSTSGTPFPARVVSSEGSGDLTLKADSVSLNGESLPQVKRDIVDAITNALLEKKLLTRESVSGQVYNNSTVHVKGSTNDQQQGFQ